MDIHNEINKSWEKEILELKKSVGIVATRQDLDLNLFLEKMCSSQERLVRKHYKEVLAILEECISWLSLLHMWLLEENELRDIGCLVGMACAQAVSIRKLILSGLDSSARAILRTLFETLCISILVLDDKALREEFRKAENTSNFWYSNFAKGKIFKKLDDLFTNRDIHDTVTKVFTDWIREEYSRLSETIHPTFRAAILSTYSKSLEDVDTFKIGTWGRATTFSESTFKNECLIIWYFSRVGFFILVSNIKKSKTMRHMLDKNDMNFLNVVLGRNVVANLVLKYI